MRLWDRLLDLAERHYARFYGASFEPRPDPGAKLQERMAAVCEAALGVAESFFHVRHRRGSAPQTGGDFVQRVFAVRQAGLQWMFREDLPDLSVLSPVERGLADRVALETWMANRHVELVTCRVPSGGLRNRLGFRPVRETVTNLRTRYPKAAT
jgi:hypothetical protein